ncbi:enolase-phosphatase E1-like isoform X2 [Hetaerina americana]|uniref:enolase-phosphatase E1-like isoform X2 n=1 Tax=Hetaerina americana TaxID=62018 RepID=UPI003A7F4E62
MSKMTNLKENESFISGDIREKMLDVEIVLSDIEGTTTSIPFVRNILKSYCKENLNKYISDHWEDDELVDFRREMKTESTGEKEDPCSATVAVKKHDLSSKLQKKSVEQYILNNLDSKQSPYSLKLLQTNMWEEGYVSSDLKGHLFPDVTPAFKKWKERGLHIYMYSSGIQLAQKLLFTHSSEGDFHELISGYFDLNVGAKVDPKSYKNIMEKVNCQPEKAVFLTDNAHADAAQKAGLIAVLVHREGNEPVDTKFRELFPSIYSFEEIISLLGKRKSSSTDRNDKLILRKKAKLECDDAGPGDDK